MTHVAGTHKHSSVGNAVFLMVKAFIGTGVLFLPKAFSNGGLAGSFILLLIMALFSMWGMWLLFRTSLAIPGSYQEIVGELYGQRVKLLFMGSLALCQYGFVMVYILFVASNVMDLISTISECEYHMDSWAILITIQLVIYIPLVLIRDIQKLTKFAVLGNFLMILGILFVIVNSVVTMFSKPMTFKIFNNLTDTSLFLGTAIFTYEGFGLVIPISQSMKDPRQFGVVLVSTIAIVSIMYILIGSLAYAAYGADIQTVVLLNMPDTIFLKLVQVGYVVAVMLSLPLQFYPAVEILEEPFFSSDPNELMRSLYRASLTIIAAIGAYFGAQSLDVFVSFIGAFCGMPVSFIYPPLIYLRACAKTPTQRFGCYFLLTFGIAATIFASTIAFFKLINGEPEFLKDRCLSTVH